MKSLRTHYLSLVIALLLALPAQAMACFHCPSGSSKMMAGMCHHTETQAPGRATLSARCCCTLNGLPQTPKTPVSEASLVSAPEVNLAVQIAVILPAVALLTPPMLPGANVRFSSSHFAQTKCAIAVLKSSFLI